MRERGREGSARDSLTRVLEFASSWQQVQQHRQAVPQTLRALERERQKRKSLAGAVLEAGSEPQKH